MKVPFRAQGMLAIAVSLVLLGFVGVQSNFNWSKIQASVQDVVTPFEDEDESLMEEVDSDAWREEELEPRSRLSTVRFMSLRSTVWLKSKRRCPEATPLRPNTRRWSSEVSPYFSHGLVSVAISMRQV